MLIMNKNGMDHLLSSQFKLGADASAAAGPVGRHASADTDWKMRAEVLTYSRARGLFAGLELVGASIKQDKDSTRDFYGRMVPFKTSLRGNIEAPQSASRRQAARPTSARARSAPISRSPAMRPAIRTSTAPNTLTAILLTRLIEG